MITVDGAPPANRARASLVADVTIAGTDDVDQPVESGTFWGIVEGKQRDARRQRRRVCECELFRRGAVQLSDARAVPL